MNFSSLFKLSFFLLASTSAIAQRTVTVTVTEEPSQTSTVATSTASTLQSVVKSTPLYASASLIQPTVVIAAAAATSTGDSDSDNGQYVDADAGASGSSDGTSFNLSQGGLIAIIVVVVIVVIFGIASTVLFVLAKRRQWNVRASVARASRRFTGRLGGGKGEVAPQRRDRRTGVYAGGARKVSPGVTAIKPPGHKRGLVVDVRDVEKASTTSNESGLTKKNWTNKWFTRK